MSKPIHPKALQTSLQLYDAHAKQLAFIEQLRKGVEQRMRVVGECIRANYTGDKGAFATLLRAVAKDEAVNVYRAHEVVSVYEKVATWPTKAVIIHARSWVDEEERAGRLSAVQEAATPDEVREAPAPQGGAAGENVPDGG